MCPAERRMCPSSGKPSTRAGPLGPDVEGKQAALLFFTTDRPGKARVAAFHLRKP